MIDLLNCDVGKILANLFPLPPPSPFSPSLSDGEVVLVGGYDGVYLSTDSGSSFSSVDLDDLYDTSSTAGFNVAMSSDASHLFAASVMGGVLTSTDKGKTWTQVNSDTTFWSSIASNSDSSVLIASSPSSSLYASYDYGETWTAFDDTGTNAWSWSYVDISADGQVMVGGSAKSAVWVSVDGGSSWATTGDVDMWTSVSLTSDGKTIVGSSAGISSMVKATYSANESSTKKHKKSSKKSSGGKSKAK